MPSKDPNEIRPSWDQYFMKMAQLASERSTCISRQVGAVLVLSNQIISTGYNGPPSTVPHCTSCLRRNQNVPSGQRHEICYAVHAEQNTIIQAARRGIAVVGSTLYSTLLPCFICTKILLNAGVSRLVYLKGYPDTLTHQLLHHFQLTQLPEIF